MSNTITITLCAEDRARLDKLTDLLGQRVAQATAIMAANYEPDPIHTALSEALASAETPQDRAGEAEAETPTTTPLDEEKPTAEESAPTAEVVEPTVTLEQIQQKVLMLAAANGGAKKAAVRGIINAYGAKVSDLKDQPDKWAEVWGKLTALESEV